MDISELCVVQLQKKQATAVGGVPFLSESFFLDTCQRQLWISKRASLRAARFIEDNGFEVLSAESAYTHLLRVITGLESAVVGETDIHGQFREAWQACQSSSDGFARELVPWIQKLLEDCKEIRSTYLSGHGGSSYGSLVRKFLKAQGHHGSILLIGAGQLAQTVAPYLLESPLLLANRSVEKLPALRAELLQIRSYAQVETLKDSSSEFTFWEKANSVVICAPPNDEADQKRISFFKGTSEKPKTILHLGILKNHTSLWSALPEFHPLDDLFALQQNQQGLRALQIQRAMKACEERARLRTLSFQARAPLRLAHGWEDLAGF